MIQKGNFGTVHINIAWPAVWLKVIFIWIELYFQCQSTWSELSWQTVHRWFNCNVQTTNWFLVSCVCTCEFVFYFACFTASITIVMVAIVTLFCHVQFVSTNNFTFFRCGYDIERVSTLACTIVRILISKIA